MRGSKGIGDLQAEVEHLRERQRTCLQPGAERLPLQPFHCDERTAAVGADLVDGADVRMIEAREALGFMPEPRQSRVVLCYGIREKLEGCPPRQAEVLRLVH